MSITLLLALGCGPKVVAPAPPVPTPGPVEAAAPHRPRPAGATLACVSRGLARDPCCPLASRCDAAAATVVGKRGAAGPTRTGRAEPAPRQAERHHPVGSAPHAATRTGGFPEGALPLAGTRFPGPTGAGLRP